MKRITSVKSFFTILLQSIAIGIAMIVPGVSGGTLAVLFGLYDDIIESISGLRKHFKDSICFLLPVLLGAILGFLILYFPLKYGLQYIPIPTVALFAGLIFGGIPSIYHKVDREKIKPLYIIIFVLAALVAALLGLFSVQLDVQISLEKLEFGKCLFVIVGGFLASCALVVPGISGSMLLLSIGLFSPIIYQCLPELLKFNASFGTCFGYIACFGIGVVIGFFVISLIMSFLLKKHSISTYWGILGFVIGSLFSIFYNNEIVGSYANIANQLWQIPLAIVLFALGTFGSLYLEKFLQKKGLVSHEN